MTNTNTKKYIAYRIPGSYDEADELYATLERAVASLVSPHYKAHDRKDTVIEGVISEGGEIKFEPCDISEFFIHVPLNEEQKSTIFATVRVQLEQDRKRNDDWVENALNSGQTSYTITGCGGIFEEKFEKWTDEKFHKMLKVIYERKIEQEEVQWNMEKL